MTRTANSAQRRKKGLFVVVLGPDGSGKSTLVERATDRLHGRFNGIWRFHWRPGLFPKPGRTRRVEQQGSSESPSPPDRYAYGYLISSFRYVYFLLDFIIGYWFLIQPKRLRNWLIIGERWYYDVLINPVRYGFQVPRWMLKLGAYLVKDPDLTILLVAEPSEIRARKPELTTPQITEQLRSMRELLPPHPKGVTVPTSGSLDESLDAFMAVVTEASGRSGNVDPDAGGRHAWRRFPRVGATKIWIDAGDNVPHALKLYQPYSLAGRAAKWLACFMPRILSTGGSISREDSQRLERLTGLIADKLQTPDIAVSYSCGTPGPHRKITAQVSRDGVVISYVKIGDSDAAKILLANEESALRRLKTANLHGVAIPRVLGYVRQENEHFLFLSSPDRPVRGRAISPEKGDVGFLGELLAIGIRDIPMGKVLGSLLSGKSGSPSFGPGGITPDIVVSARKFLLEKGDSSVRVGFCHGDFAPWNTLRIDDGGLYVFDWEYADTDAPLFTDLFHRVFMPDWLVRSITPRQAVSRLNGLWADARYSNYFTRSGIPESEYVSYILLYFLRLLDREIVHKGNSPDYLASCISILLKEAGANAGRRKVLVSAYACEPDKGSEPGVGWHWVEQIARDNEAWIITRRNNRESLENELRARPNPYLHFVYVDLPRSLSFWKRGQRGVRTYYYLWQFAAFLKARKLHRVIRFDVGHHVTFVNDWLWSFFALMPIPYVWGPIGSHPPCPGELLPHGKARIQEWIRLSIQRTARLVDPLYWLTVARAAVVIPGSREVATRFQLHLLASERCVVESGIGIEDVPAMEADSRRKNNIILYVGRFHYVKCPHIVIEAFSVLARSMPDARLVMIGSGPEEKNLREKVGVLGLGDRVEFPGWKDRADVLKDMENASVFLFPSAEGAGMVVLEAMACGLPVVCLDFGGPGDMVENGCGIRVPLGTQEAIITGLGEALVTLCSNAELRAEMGGKARRLVQTKHDWRHKREVLSTVYDRIYVKSGNEIR
jgi:glycosyltransferase involved in cell wall biosynthesis/thymidylate kinase